VTNFICPTSGTTIVTLSGGTWTKATTNITSLDYLALVSCAASPELVWYAGVHSYIVSGACPGWIFGTYGGGGGGLSIHSSGSLSIFSGGSLSSFTI
jgi:hypothetical protein